MKIKEKEYKQKYANLSTEELVKQIEATGGNPIKKVENVSVPLIDDSVEVKKRTRKNKKKKKKDKAAEDFKEEEDIAEEIEGEECEGKEEEDDDEEREIDDPEFDKQI